MLTVVSSIPYTKLYYGKQRRAMPKTILLIIIILIFNFNSFTALAQESGEPDESSLSNTISLSGGGEVWLYPLLGGHGYLLLALEIDGLSGGSSLLFEYNTDTIRISLTKISFLGGLMETGAQVVGEFMFTGLLPDYYKGSKSLEERGFSASHVLVEAYLKANLPANNYLEIALGGKKWFFSRLEATASELVLPPDAWVLQPRLRYTYWNLEMDPSISDRHRTFWRVAGLAAGLEIGADFRSDVRAWGALDLEHFAEVDSRNDPNKISYYIRQWSRLGWKLTDRLRTQILQASSFGVGEDDLTRIRLGGMNPYVIPVAGAPWAGYLSEKFLSLESSWHFRVYKEVEIGVLVDAVLMADPKRAGNDDVGVVMGAGFFGDLRFGDMQIDIRAGWTPGPDWNADPGQFTLFAGVGSMW